MDTHHRKPHARGETIVARHDVSDLVAKEQALQASQAQLQAIIGTAGVAIITLDVEGHIHTANPATSACSATR